MDRGTWMGRSTILSLALLVCSVACGAGDSLPAIKSDTPGTGIQRPAATVAPTPPATMSLGIASVAPRCGAFDDYQTSSLAFFSLALFLDQAWLESGGEPEERSEAMRRFADVARRAEDGEVVVPADSIEELALFWVASDGCMQ